ncbi:hypothetical protein NDU88_009041 [Pleurodeles waltl]|uniref:Uncharacterized protein n=1 Tax=Pleurodeles waltl TaxID=8319 RepID=A0AAV7QWB1_PLEWA|nr:hypothetical protein NDU88_009041 [Pleurodeles waltl]
MASMAAVICRGMPHYLNRSFRHFLPFSTTPTLLRCSDATAHKASDGRAGGAGSPDSGPSNAVVSSQQHLLFLLFRLCRHSLRRVHRAAE